MAARIDVGILAQQHGVRVEAVLGHVHQPGAELVQRVDRGGNHRRVDVGDADFAGDVGRPQGLHGQAVAEQLVVDGRQRLQHERFARRVHAQRIAVGGDGGRFVDGHPARHPVAVGGRRDRGELPQPVGRVPVHPAAGLVQRQRRVPVIQRGHRRNPVGQQQVDQPVVEVEAGRIHRAAAAGLDPGPGQREPVGINPQFLHQRHVLGHPVVVVAGDGGAVVLNDRARLGRENIPPEGPRPSSSRAPSIWKAAVATPRVKRGGSRAARSLAEAFIGGIPFVVAQVVDLILGRRRTAHATTGDACGRRTVQVARAAR